MDGVKFEGDFSNINDAQLNYLKKVIEGRGYTNNKVIINPLGAAGDNYVANVKRVVIEDGNGGVFRMVVKLAPQQEFVRKMSSMDRIFMNEHIMYTKVLPKFTQLEISAGVPPEDRLRYAACYGSSMEAPNEIIILEDLAVTNHIMLNRFKPLSNESVLSILRDFALLHSLSYALKHKEPEVYEEFKNDLFDKWSFLFESENMVKLFKSFEQSAIDIVTTDIYKAAIRDSVKSNWFKMYGKLAKIDRDSKHAVIIQGDAWTNNVMFKYDGDKLQESVMIDYQASTSGNPTTDILYLIFNATDYETRKEHFTEWIDYYHSELDKSLSNFGLKANYIYSRDHLDADMKRHGKTSLAQFVVMIAALVMKPEDASQIREAVQNADESGMKKSSTSAVRDPKSAALYRDRVEGIVRSFIDFGLIHK